jgi:hypothetical protein
LMMCTAAAVTSAIYVTPPDKGAARSGARALGDNTRNLPWHSALAHRRTTMKHFFFSIALARSTSSDR